MTARLVRRERCGDFDRLVLDSPHNRNAMSLRLLDDLVDGIARCAQSGRRGLVLAHSGTVFCAGVDLRERRDLADDSHSRRLALLLEQLWSFPKPVLTTINGALRGGGMGLIACSDIVVAAPTSTFAYAEVRVGVAPALVMAVTLPGVALRPLLPWLLTGAVFDAHIATELGLVTNIVPAGEEVDDGAALAGLVLGAPGAQVAVKRLARAAAGVDMAALLSRMAEESAALFRSPEAAEGMAAFAARRTPAWVGARPAAGTAYIGVDGDREG